tara:strand:+ start:686 stop:1258 length:573 start_codon:yes stop_codon:yes gene_type:complete
MASITSFPSGVSGSSLVLISEQTASSSSTITFDSGIDSTYKEYIFKFIDIHMATSDASLTVNFRDGGSNYDATKTTSFFAANHPENDSSTSLAYASGADLAQSTGAQKIATSVGNDNDENFNGELYLFNPSSTTFVKHFIGVNQISNHSDTSAQEFYAGYCNVTAAIDGVQFSTSAGTFETGRIALYGIK